MGAIGILVIVIYLEFRIYILGFYLNFIEILEWMR
jgi:hypothetical protein